MIVLYETQLSKEETKFYLDKGYRIASIFDKPFIRPGESVGIVITKLYKTTVEYIDNLLYRNDRVNPVDYKPDKNGVMQAIRKHGNKFINKLTIRYKDNEPYHLTSLSEWRCKHQSESDQIKEKTDYHPIYKVYLEQMKEYRLSKEAEKLQQQYELYSIDISDEALDAFLSTYAYQYDVDIYTDYSNKLDKLKAYQQIKFYMDNDLPIINEPTDVEIISFGNETYLEDFIYKNEEQEGTC